MRRVNLAKSAALMLAAVIAAMSLTASAQAAEIGTISGTFTDTTGAPLQGVYVSVEKWECCGGGGSGSTDADGHYQIAGVPVGDYRIRFHAPGYQTQYAYQTADYSSATKITVSSGAVSVVDDHLMPFGTFTGRFTDAGGLGLADLGVDFSSERGHALTSRTDENGYFTGRVHPGRYKISFDIYPGVPGEAQRQYVPGTDSHQEAQVFDLAAGATVTVNDTLMVTGFISGRFTDANGTGMAGVMAIGKRGETGWRSAITDASGDYRMRVKTGAYKVLFDGPSFDQYAYGKVSEVDAAVFQVTQGQTTVVNDSRLLTGSVRVTARDAATGTPITVIAAGLAGGAGTRDPNDTDGVELFTEVPIGAFQVSLYAYGYKQQDNAGTVTVVAGQQTAIEITMQRATRIDATVVDAVTGQPLQGVCLLAGTRDHFSTPDGGCYESGPDGKAMVEIWHNQPGQYQVLAFPANAPGYGAQWVGPNGGTGSQLEAQSITVQVDQASNAPVVKMDRAGTITGHITPSAPGSPLPFTEISLADWSFRAGGGYGIAHTDDEGTYSIDFLGPYQWPLRFSNNSEAVQWSGGKGNRHEAHKVQVTANATTTYDYQFRAGTPVDITVPFATGSCVVVALNAATGDQQADTDFTCGGGPLRINVVDGQEIKLRLFYGESGGSYQSAWHMGNDFRSAGAILVNGPVSLTFVPGTPLPVRRPAPETPTVPVPRRPGVPHATTPPPRR
ncbi:MAG TPA: hypothetical protein DGT23_33575 [Micromonosporaceae bacterium]|nr:hypothetical protein [Micromonosporaceae bacterium]